MENYQSSEESDHSIEEGPSCTRCGLNTAVYDENRTKAEADVMLDDDGDMTVEWKPSDCKLVDFLVCTDCKIFRVLCKKCNEPCSLVGHMGYKNDGTQWQRTGSAKSSEKELPANAKVLDTSAARYDISDQGKTSVNVAEWIVCGPDGKMPHFWNCPDCGADYKFSRK